MYSFNLSQLLTRLTHTRRFRSCQSEFVVDNKRILYHDKLQGMTIAKPTLTGSQNIKLEKTNRADIFGVGDPGSAQVNALDGHNTLAPWTLDIPRVRLFTVRL